MNKIWKKNKLKSCFENIQGKTLKSERREERIKKKTIVGTKPDIF
jgi:hypothetical protein